MHSGAGAGRLRAGCKPKSEALALLSQLLARLHGIDVPVVQVIQASPRAHPSHIARSLAEASTATLGRTLLVSLHAPGEQQAGVSAPAAAGLVVRRRRAKKGVSDAPEIVPDSSLPGLYHAGIGCQSDEATRIDYVPPGVWLGGVNLNFRLLIIDCGPLDLCPAAVEVASRCHGSVLGVAAGVTRLAEVQMVAAQVQLAGGRLLGSVLYDAPTAPWPKHLSRARAKVALLAQGIRRWVTARRRPA